MAWGVKLNGQFKDGQCVARIGPRPKSIRRFQRKEKMGRQKGSRWVSVSAKSVWGDEGERGDVTSGRIIGRWCCQVCVKGNKTKAGTNQEGKQKKERVILQDEDPGGWYPSKTHDWGTCPETRAREGWQSAGGS